MITDKKEACSSVLPIFFATDEKYVPFLTVALTSLLDKASRDYEYRFYVLTTDLREDLQYMVRSVVDSWDGTASIEFISLKHELDKVSGLFHLRDYYSKETYYRFFIPNLFPDYDKVLYLDCDIIVREDISKLFNIQLGSNLVAAAPEEVMQEYDVFGSYVEKTLGCSRYTYFNAGILLINAREFRRQNIAQQFVDLISNYTFSVTQDEDYLNVLCKGRAVLLDLGWNKTAFKNEKFDDSSLKIVHYKINWKPWHYENVAYEEYFWDYARKSPFYQDLLDMRAAYGEKEKAADQLAFERLAATARRDSEDPDNYWNSVNRRMALTERFFIAAGRLLKSVGFRRTANAE